MSNLAVIDRPTETIEAADELLSPPKPTVRLKVSSRPAGKLARVTVAEIHGVDLAKGIVSELVTASMNIEPAHPKVCFCENVRAFLDECKKLSRKGSKNISEEQRRAPEVEYASDGFTRDKHGKPCENYKFSVSIYVEDERDIVANASVELPDLVGKYLLINTIVMW